MPPALYPFFPVGQLENVTTIVLLNATTDCGVIYHLDCDAGTWTGPLLYGNGDGDGDHCRRVEPLAVVEAFLLNGLVETAVGLGERESEVVWDLDRESSYEDESWARYIGKEQ